MKYDIADNLFGRYIKELAEWKCEYCSVDYRENPRGLNCSHYWGRAKKNTRFEPDNCMALCYGHHKRLGHGDGREEYKRIMIRKLGEKRFKSLDMQAHTPAKDFDWKLERVKWRLALKELIK